MNADECGTELLTAIKDAFPDVSFKLDKYLEEYFDYQSGDPLPWADMIERFSQYTTEAIARQDEIEASAHLAFIEKRLSTATPLSRKIIDTYYVESLLISIKDAQIKRWGWSLIPPSLKELYVAMWGEPDF